MNLYIIFNITRQRLVSQVFEARGLKIEAIKISDKKGDSGKKPSVSKIS